MRSTTDDEHRPAAVPPDVLAELMWLTHMREREPAEDEPPDTQRSAVASRVASLRERGARLRHG